MPEKSDNLEQILSQQQQELERMRDALALLGVYPCGACLKFFRRTDAGILFDAGEQVCYGCIRDWWPRRSAGMAEKEREDLEGKLVFWLRDYHHAETVKDPAKLPEQEQQDLQIVANCLECRGTGRSGGDERCRFCDGRGTVWVIVPRKKV